MQLNPEQLAAVMYRGGNLLVYAGAGTGKTTLMAARAAALINEGCWPGSIVAITYTNSAARRLHAAVAQRVDSRAPIVASTLHAYALSVLRRQGNDWDVLSASSAASLLTMLRRELALGLPADIKSFRLVELFSYAVNADLPLDQVVSSKRLYAEFLPKLLLLYEAFCAYKQAHRLLDYDDILQEFLLHLANPQPASWSSRRYAPSPCRHLIVDEAQDLSRLQLRVVLAIARTACVAAVGDPAQAIYGFRGAAPAVLTDLADSLNAKVFRLSCNYRSSQAILDAACQLAAQDSSLRDVWLRSDLAGTAPVIRLHASELAEARHVALAVHAQVLAGVDPADIACLAGSAVHLGRLQHELTALGVPFHVRGGRRMAESVVVADLLALLRVSLRPDDQLGLRRLLLLIEGIGDASADKIIARGFGQPDFEEAAPKRSRDALKALLAVFAAVEDSDPAAAWESIWSWYAPHCSLPYQQQEADQLRDVLLDRSSVSDFLEQFALDGLRVDHAGVCLSTIHSGKGLEFKIVHLLHVSSEAWPSPGTAEYPESVRKLHVAMTRAAEEEYIHVPLFVTMPDRSMRPVTHAPHISFLV